MKIYKLIRNLCLTITFLLAACTLKPVATGEPSVIDKSFLTGVPCEAPCWYGLKINQSTREDILSTLDNLPFIEHDTYKAYETGWVGGTAAEELQFTCTSHRDSPCGGALISNGVLKRLWLTVNYDLSIQDAVHKLGVPDLLEYSWPTLSGECSIETLWRAHGVSVKMYDREDYNECKSIIDGNDVSPDILVRTIIYSSREGFDVLGDCCHRIPWPGLKKP